MPEDDLRRYIGCEKNRSVFLHAKQVLEGKMEWVVKVAADEHERGGGIFLVLCLVYRSSYVRV